MSKSGGALVPLEVSEIDANRLARILERDESQYCDFKAREISPRKLSRTLSALANAEGGEVFLGIAEVNEARQWVGFDNPEGANAHIQVLDQLFPLGVASRATFLAAEDQLGLVLHIEVDKTPDIRPDTEGKIYLRRGAQNLPQTTDEQIHRLKLNKGLATHEDQTLRAELETITNSEATIEFMLDAVPTAEPIDWLKKQRLIVGNLPVVAGVLLFSDEPQTDIPKASIKIYRYRTSDSVGTRDALLKDPISIDGCAYRQIYAAVEATKSMLEEAPVMGPVGLEKIEYPTEALHEVITNAVIHRDYSLADDIHVRIFENRIEVQSPGTLPAHVTVENILEERAARNPKLVRLLNKFRNPPNKDVGEGLNTAFEAMRKLKLKDPIVQQKEAGVLVVLRHEKLGTPEQLIVEYLRDHAEINNSIAREICLIGSENTVKRILAKMVANGLIERVPGRVLNKTGYSKGPQFPA